MPTCSIPPVNILHLPYKDYNELKSSVEKAKNDTVSKGLSGVSGLLSYQIGYYVRYQVRVRSARMLELDLMGPA